jgi:hypothetical protein
MAMFIDFEAFQHGNEDFMIKELCILDESAPLKPLTFVFKPTKPWDKLNGSQKRTYAYQEHKLHQLAWNEGSKSYCNSCVERNIKRAMPLYENANCYVVGKQKADFLRRELPMLNIIEFSFVDSYKDLPRAPAHLSCTYRYHGKEHCAVLKCYRLMLHYQSL